MACSEAPQGEVCSRVHKASTRRYAVTLVGLGAMGCRHARVLRSLADRFDLVGGFDVRGDAVSAKNVVSLRSEAEAIARAEIVIIATPIETHGCVVSSALAARRHVLVEKPLCATAAEARSAVAASQQGGRLFVGHSERFNPVVRALARLIAREDVVAIDLRRVGQSKPSRHGVLLNLGVHDLDLVVYLAGPARLRAAVGARRSETEGDDLAHVWLTTASGAVAHVHVDRSVPIKQRRITVKTRRWTYEGDLVAHRLVRVDPLDASRSEIPLTLDEPLVAQATALADALEGGEAREIASGHDGASAVALAEEAAARCASIAPLSVRLQPSGSSEELGIPR